MFADKLKLIPNGIYHLNEFILGLEMLLSNKKEECWWPYESIEKTAAATCCCVEIRELNNCLKYFEVVDIENDWLGSFDEKATDEMLLFVLDQIQRLGLLDGYVNNSRKT